MCEREGSALLLLKARGDRKGRHGRKVSGNLFSSSEVLDVIAPYPSLVPDSLHLVQELQDTRTTLSFLTDGILDSRGRKSFMLNLSSFLKDLDGQESWGSCEPCRIPFWCCSAKLERNCCVRSYSECFDRKALNVEGLAADIFILGNPAAAPAKLIGGAAKPDLPDNNSEWSRDFMPGNQHDWPGS